ncbi:MAG TPA: DUF6496 domain-containing protein [Flavobacteriales bacterium]|nr:DUF6496 domain-containing protein [Flavobacteriales bacterium]
MAKYSKKAQDKVGEVMREYKEGKLKSGKDGKGGKVKNRKQAVAIALSEARDSGAKVPSKKSSTSKKKASGTKKTTSGKPLTKSKKSGAKSTSKKAPGKKSNSKLAPETGPSKGKSIARAKSKNKK